MILLERTTVGEPPLVYLNALHWYVDGTDTVFVRPKTLVNSTYGDIPVKEVLRILTAEIVSINGVP